MATPQRTKTTTRTTAEDRHGAQHPPRRAAGDPHRLGDRRRRHAHVQDVERAERDLGAAQRAGRRQAREPGRGVHRARLGGVAGDELDQVARAEIAVAREPVPRPQRPGQEPRLDDPEHRRDVGRARPGEDERRRASAGRRPAPPRPARPGRSPRRGRSRTRTTRAGGRRRRCARCPGRSGRACSGRARSATAAACRRTGTTPRCRARRRPPRAPAPRRSRPPRPPATRARRWRCSAR